MPQLQKLVLWHTFMLPHLLAADAPEEADINHPGQTDFFVSSGQLAAAAAPGSA
jgi:hypothetical protein